MSAENLAYAVVQVVHNFGAAAVVGGALAARWLAAPDVRRQRQLAWLVLAGWAAQAGSGALFGAISLHYYGQFPDLHGTAVAALVLLPLGTQLYTATSHRPDGVPPKPETVVSTTTTQIADKPVVTSTAKTDTLTLKMKRAAMQISPRSPPRRRRRRPARS